MDKSDPAWQANFGGDPAIVGSTVYVQTHPFTVAGVAPPGFFGDRMIERPPDFWMPLSNEPTIEGAGTSLWSQGEADTAWLYLLGRVRPQTSIPALQTKLSADGIVISVQDAAKTDVIGRTAHIPLAS